MNVRYIDINNSVAKQTALWQYLTICTCRPFLFKISSLMAQSAPIHLCVYSVFSILLHFIFFYLRPLVP